MFFLISSNNRCENVAAKEVESTKIYAVNVAGGAAMDDNDDYFPDLVSAPAAWQLSPWEIDSYEYSWHRKNRAVLLRESPHDHHASRCVTCCGCDGRLETCFSVLRVWPSKKIVYLNLSLMGCFWFDVTMWIAHKVSLFLYVRRSCRTYSSEFVIKCTILFPSHHQRQQLKKVTKKVHMCTLQIIVKSFIAYAR